MSKKPAPPPPTYDMQDWALAYAAEGFAVVPVWPRKEDGAGGWTCACEKGNACDRPAKHPIPRQGVKQATTDPARIQAWWEEHPEANVAVATGSVSKIIVVDVDTGGEKAGDVSITAACAEHGGVPRTLKATSGSGGRHYVYRFRENPFTRKIGFLKDVDYLSDGGYVIVAPSRNLKGEYAWDLEVGVANPGDVRKLRLEMAELPEWFDKLEGAGRAGKKRKNGSESREAAFRARIVNAASMEFKPNDPRWIEEVEKALTHCDPDSRDAWVLFGIILGREFERNDDGWQLYNDWASRSAKYSDKGTQKAMRSYYYDESNNMPQGGEPATIATLFRRAQEGGWQFPVGGLDRRPVVPYRSGRAIETLNAILTLLARERESESDTSLRIYAFGSGLGSVIETHDYGADYTAEGRPPNGWVLRVSPYSSMSLGSRITHTATIVRFSATGSTTQTECPTEVSSLMLSDYSKHFPRLNGIVQWPIIIDGKLAGFDEPYEPKAGLYFALPEGLDMSALTGNKREAQEAWTWVRDVALADFPFGSDRDAAAALTMLLTFMQRRAMSAAPAFLVTAPIQGSGKSSLVQFCSRAVHGRTVGASPLSMVGEEQRKSITAALVSNPPSLFFDNLKNGMAFDSAELAIAMTSGEWEDRKLGETQRLTLPNRAVWCFTGNNISLKNDLRRRFVTIRMVPKSAGHFEQHFSRNLDVWPVQNRHDVLRALAKILLWGARSDVKLPTESGFQAWDAQVRRVVYALTGVDPFKSVAEQSEDETEDEQEEAIGAIVTAWAALCGEQPFTVGEFATKVQEATKSSAAGRKRIAQAVEGAVAVLREKPVAHLDSKDWGYAIKLLQDRPITMSGQQCAFVKKGAKHKTALWVLVGGDALSNKLEGEF